MKPKVVPIAEEKLEVGKRRVETGRVRVRKRVEERVEQVDLPVSREVVEVRRVAVNRPVETVPEIQEREDEIIVPVVEEELVVTRRLVVKEEIHLITRRSSEHRVAAVTLRRESAEIERE
jgi:uncharacterized protein (TIGR02271 family)